MRVALLSTASVIGLLALAGPAAAGPNMTGVGQLYVGGGSTEGSFFAGKLLDDPFLYGGKAQGYWPLSPDVHLQVDLFAQQTDDLYKTEVALETDATRFGGAVHLIHPFEDRARFGVAASIWNTDVSAFDGGESDLDLLQTDATYGLVALEAQAFGSDWTATGQAGIFTTFSCDIGSIGCPGVVEDGSFVRGKLRYYLSDNTALSVEGLQMWGSVDDDIFGGKTATFNSTIWTLEAEHKFADSPYSGFVSLSHEHDVAEGFFSTTANTQSITIGVKFYLDQPSLRSNDKTGAAFDTPQFGNALENSGPLSIFGISP